MNYLYSFISTCIAITQQNLWVPHFSIAKPIKIMFTTGFNWQWIIASSLDDPFALLSYYLRNDWVTNTNLTFFVVFHKPFPKEIQNKRAWTDNLVSFVANVAIVSNINRRTIEFLKTEPKKKDNYDVIASWNIICSLAKYRKFVWNISESSTSKSKYIRNKFF